MMEGFEWWHVLIIPIVVWIAHSNSAFSEKANPIAMTQLREQQKKDYEEKRLQKLVKQEAEKVVKQNESPFFRQVFFKIIALLIRWGLVVGVLLAFILLVTSEDFNYWLDELEAINLFFFTATILLLVFSVPLWRFLHIKRDGKG